MKSSLIVLALLVCAVSALAQNVGQDKGDTTIVNYTDIQGNKQGKWEKKYKNNVIAYQANFLNNKLVGEYKRFYETGAKKAIVLYDKKGNVGYATFYWDNGKLMAKGKYINQNVKDSCWQFYGTDGVLMAEECYKNGAKNGVLKSYFRDGKVAEEIGFTDGVKDGVWRTYYENGQKRFETKHVKGIRTGPFIAYYENGNPKVQGKYINDFPDGKWITYTPDFKVEKELEYKNGKLVNEELYDAEFKKQFLEWEQNKGKFVEPDADENLKKLFGLP